MTTAEILKAATPRPWKHGGFYGDSQTAQANSALAKLAVNAYEHDQATIKALVDALGNLQQLVCNVSDLYPKAETRVAVVFIRTQMAWNDALLALDLAKEGQ